MKSTIFKTLALCFMALSLWSCKKDETQTVSNVEAAGTLTASATTINLVQANGTQEALQLTYPLATSSGYVVPVTSTLQFGLKGKNFDPVREVVVTSKTYAPTIADFNNMILALGGKVNEAAQIEVRLKSGAAVNDLTYSNVITLSATPYLASAWIYVPGAYQGWNPATADSLVSPSSNGVYEGIIRFDGEKFKITPAKKWDLAYGDAGGGKLSTSGGDISSVSAGLKLLTVDLNKFTYTITNADYWSIIGNAIPGTNWDTDVDMKPVNDGKNTWVATVALGVGEFKFRQNHKWDISIGNGADNIKITTAGTYKLTLNLEFKDPMDSKKITSSSYTVTKI